jgi:hypothetical protein
MAWQINLHTEFEVEYRALSQDVRDSLLEAMQALAEFGPSLGRPHADTLKGSKYANMKELRFNAGDGVWRVAFAFDPKRNGILLVAGDKAGAAQKAFYKSLINRADARFGRHLNWLKAAKR